MTTAWGTPFAVCIVKPLCTKWLCEAPAALYHNSPAGRSRVFGRSHRVNLMHPLQPVATMLSPTAAMPTNAIPSVSMPTVTMPTVTMPTVTMSAVSIPKPTGVTQSATKLTVSKSPLKRKG